MPMQDCQPVLAGTYSTASMLRDARKIFIARQCVMRDQRGSGQVRMKPNACISACQNTEMAL
eukprot:6177884-Pleurochrysis_carterae.AAC.1